MKKNPKPRIGIFDLTDCEGCELEVINFREKLLDLLEGVEIVSWRLAQGKDAGSFDVAFIEGTPITLEEQAFLKNIRDNSKILVALGACACLGGIPGIIRDEERPRIYREVYPSDYKPRGVESKPLSAYVKVDYFLDGCPVDSTRELERVLCDLISGKMPETPDHPVCLDCKVAGNTCLLANDIPCLGPIIQGGCGAFCVSHGKHCYGCYGLVKDANFERMVERLNEIQSEKKTQNLLSMFLSEMPEYKRLYEQ